MKYNPRVSIIEAKKWEAVLDRHFCRVYEITPVSLDVEKEKGIDRVFMSRETGAIHTVEYKTDHKAHRTGNVYVETLVVTPSDGVSITKPGWALHSAADVLVYYIPASNIAHFVRMSDLRPLLQRWEAVYKRARCENKTDSGREFHSVGILVPLSAIPWYHHEFVDPVHQEGLV